MDLRCFKGFVFRKNIVVSQPELLGLSLFLNKLVNTDDFISIVSGYKVFIIN
jgi:hypothetical protein